MMQIKHDPQSGRFYTASDGESAELTYQHTGKRLIADHTYVPKSLRGQGVAAKLVDAFLSYAKSEHLAITPQCSYIAAYMKRKGIQ